MPIYEYRCGTCGYQKEYLQKVNDPRLTDCPQCGKATFNKLLSAAGFQLKGNGWYVTDFRDKGTKPKDGVTAKDSATAKDGAKTSAAPEKAESSESKKEEKPEPARGAGACPACT